MQSKKRNFPIVELLTSSNFLQFFIHFLSSLPMLLFQLSLHRISHVNNVYVKIALFFVQFVNFRLWFSLLFSFSIRISLLFFCQTSGLLYVY